MAAINYTGGCFCGKVKFEIDGIPLANAYCHCYGCSMGVGMSPVHCVLILHDNFRYIKGEEWTRTYDGSGPMKFVKCTECGANTFQYPEGGPYKAIYPRMLHGYREGKTNLLPDDLQPQAHVNYENRLTDWHDDLPKFDKLPPAEPPKEEVVDETLPFDEDAIDYSDYDSEVIDYSEFEPKATPKATPKARVGGRKHWWDK